MTIDEQIESTKWEIKTWKAEIVKRKKAVRCAESMLKTAQYNEEVWQGHLRILLDERSNR